MLLVLLMLLLLPTQPTRIYYLRSDFFSLPIYAIVCFRLFSASTVAAAAVPVATKAARAVCTPEAAYTPAYTRVYVSIYIMFLIC